VQTAPEGRAMRFAIISDSIRACTGFGKQTRQLALKLCGHGHEVVVIARPPLVAFCDATQYADMKEGLIERLAEQFFEPSCVEQMVLEVQPDVVILFRNARYLEKYERSILFSVFKTLVWYANENEAADLHELSTTIGFPDGSMLPVSNAVAAGLPERKVAATLHHGMDFDARPAIVDRSDLRRKWSNVIGVSLVDEDILLICADRNDVRKNWDGTYALFAAIQQRMHGVRVRLLQITTRTETEPYFDLKLCGSFYGVLRDVVDVSASVGALTDNDLYELLLAADLRISCSGAEGFGLLSLESAALRVPQVTVKLNALTEYLGKDNAGLVDPFRLAVYPTDSFYYSSKIYAIPDIERMADRAVELMTDASFREAVVDASYNQARALCSWETVAERLLAVVESTPNPRESGYRPPLRRDQP
jgi:glycosyltransferase involved in cell wall biosynthesis